MIVEVDYKHFQGLLNKHYPDNPVTEAEAAEAFHNLVGFVNLLMQINNRVGLVPHDPEN
ncbi:MAG: hypothetical protein PHX43_09240 [Alphaproteobacteria bacterium]|nr:hypothetical protein [Alphaproteobacteria bacterium]